MGLQLQTHFADGREAVQVRSFSICVVVVTHFFQNRSQQPHYHAHSIQINHQSTHPSNPPTYTKIPVLGPPARPGRARQRGHHNAPRRVLPGFRRRRAGPPRGGVPGAFLNVFMYGYVRIHPPCIINHFTDDVNPQSSSLSKKQHHLSICNRDWRSCCRYTNGCGPWWRRRGRGGRQEAVVVADDCVSD